MSGSKSACEEGIPVPRTPQRSMFYRCIFKVTYKYRIAQQLKVTRQRNTDKPTNRLPFPEDHASLLLCRAKLSFPVLGCFSFLIQQHYICGPLNVCVQCTTLRLLLTPSSLVTITPKCRGTVVKGLEVLIAPLALAHLTSNHFQSSGEFQHVPALFT